jgi:ribosomal protein L29
MKPKKLREQSVEELRQLGVDTRRRMAEMRAKKGTKDATDQPMQRRVLRRDLARILTVLREREEQSHAGA